MGGFKRNMEDRWDDSKEFVADHWRLPASVSTLAVLVMAGIIITPYSALFVVPLFGGIASLFWIGFSIYTSIAISYSNRALNDPKPLSYRKQLRQLREQRVRYQREFYSNKNRPVLQRTPEHDLKQINKRIAEHMGRVEN